MITTPPTFDLRCFEYHDRVIILFMITIVRSIVGSFARSRKKIREPTCLFKKDKLHLRHVIQSIFS